MQSGSLIWMVFMMVNVVVFDHVDIEICITINKCLQKPMTKSNAYKHYFYCSKWLFHEVSYVICARRGDLNLNEWFSWRWMWLYLTKLISKFASLFKHACKSQWQRVMLRNTPIVAHSSFKKWVIWHILGWILVQWAMGI